VHAEWSLNPLTFADNNLEVALGEHIVERTLLPLFAESRAANPPVPAILVNTLLVMGSCARSGRHPRAGAAPSPCCSALPHLSALLSASCCYFAK